MSQSDSHSFKIPSRRIAKPADPEVLFRHLGGRSAHVQHLWAHQADVLRNWHSGHVDTADVALELPTGTGKTLIGLLIGEFVRQTKGERVAYLCPNRQLAHQVGVLAEQYSIDARVLVGTQASYNPADFNAFVNSSAVAVTTYSAVFNTNPRINSANLLILDDAHAGEDFIASLWNVEVNRDDYPDIYLALLEFFRDVIPGSQLWNLKQETTADARSETGKIPSTVVHRREAELREYLNSALGKSALWFPWTMVRGHLDACHIFITWPSISIRPIIPPTFNHDPFSKARQRIYMSATLGEGGELERITGIRRIERLPVPESWKREGTGRRFILFPDQKFPVDTARHIANTLMGDPIRSLILTPSRTTAKSVATGLENLNPSPSVFYATDVENSLDPFIEKDHAALVLHNRYDGLDLPGDACHLEWICGLPGATNAQEAFLLNRLGVYSLLRDRIRTRLTQALGRCTRHATDHAVVVITGADALDFCNRFENRSGFHPELQAEIQYGLEASEVQWPQDLVEVARAFLQKRTGWEEVDQWIRDERDSYLKQEDKVAQTLIDNVRDEIDYARAVWVGNYQTALEKARACADRLSGKDLADYRAWWYYLAGSVAALSSKSQNLPHLSEVARDMFERACRASPRSTWFREATKFVDFEVSVHPVDDSQLLSVSEVIEKRLHQMGVTGAGFEREAQSLIDLVDNDEAKSFEQGIEKLGFWLGVAATRPQGQGVPDGVWTFSEGIVVAFEAKSEEGPVGSIALRTAREAQGHVNWVGSNMPVSGSTSVFTVIVSNRTSVTAEAVPNAQGLFVVSLVALRDLAKKVVSTLRALRAQASANSNEDLRQVIAERLKSERLDPMNVQAQLLGSPLGDFPVEGSASSGERG